MKEQTLLEKIRAIKELEILIEEAQHEIDSYKDDIKTELEKRQIEEMTVDIFKVKYTTVTSNRIDTTVIKKELPEVAARYSKQQTIKRFTIN